MKPGRPFYKALEPDAQQTPQRNGVDDGEMGTDSGIGDFQKQRQADVSRATRFEVKQR